MLAGYRVAVALMMGASAAVLAPSRVGTSPLEAARSGQACGTCHVDPDGGGPRNERGVWFARNRHLIAVRDTLDRWSPPTGRGRERTTAPLLVGVDHRIAFVASQLVGEDVGRRTFVSAPTSIHLSVLPHRQLALVYTMEGRWDWEEPRFDLRTTRAFGLIAGLPWNGYLKAGRLFVPFGLRMDDPQVATRSGIGYFYTGGAMLPFEPQKPDMGIEIGASSGALFGRASFTNGFSEVLANGFAEAKTAKVGYAGRTVQIALSVYDDLFKVRTTPLVRYTYASIYGLARRGPVAWIGEIAFGTNSLRPAAGPPSRDVRMLGGFAEVDWAFAPRGNARLRYDRLERGRDQGQPARDMSTFDRYSLEGEWGLFPMARLRVAARYTDPVYPAFPPDAREALIELQLSY